MPTEGRGLRRRVPVRSLPWTSGGATSGAHVGPRSPAPLPGVGARIPGRGLGDPGSSSLVPCSPPGAWPGPDSASARPCAPPHTRAHTHSHSLARSHTRTPLPPPPLFISSSCLGTQEKPSTAPASRRLRALPVPHTRQLRYGDVVRQLPEWRARAPAAPPPPAPGQRLLPGAPTNLLVREPPRPIRFASRGTGSQWAGGKKTGRSPGAFWES